MSKKQQLEVQRTKFLVAKNDHQKDYIKLIKEKTIIFAIGPAGAGKAQPYYSKIYTPNGFTTMGDIQVGDEICTVDGKTTKVLGKFPQGKKKIYRIHFDQGDYVDCCENHLWKVHNKQYKGPLGKYRIRETKELYQLWLGGKRHGIELTQPLNFKSSEVLIDPYLLGVLIGDGSIINRIMISSADQEILDRINKKLKTGYTINKYSKYDYALIKNNIDDNITYKEALVHYNLMGHKCYTKFIPKEYLYNSVEIRLELLKGLLDTDGSVDENGNIEYTTTSPQLSEDVKFLVESLGGICRIVSRKTKFTYKGIKKEGAVSYRCHIRFNNNIQPFGLSRKANRVSVRTKYFPHRYITRIEKLDIEEECYCIYVDHPDHLYITDHCVVTHNTRIACSIALEELTAGKIDKIVLSRPVLEAGESLGFLPGDLSEKIDPYMQPIFNEFKESIDEKELKTYIATKQIEIVPLAFMQGRNFKNSIVIIDEAQGATYSQLKNVLTRLSEGGKLIIGGDPTQSYLPIHSQGAMEDIMYVLKDMQEVGIVQFTREDIVRHPLIGKILDRLDKLESNENKLNQPLRDTWREYYDPDAED